MMFGVGAVLGGLAVGALRQLPLWPVTVGIVTGWGLALLPFGFDVPGPHGRLLHARRRDYGPFVALSVTLMQAKSPPQHLAAMLAPQRGAADRLPAEARRSATGSRPRWAARDTRRLGPRHRGARRRRLRPAIFPGQLPRNLRNNSG